MVIPLKFSVRVKRKKTLFILILASEYCEQMLLLDIFPFPLFNFNNKGNSGKNFKKST